MSDSDEFQIIDSSESCASGETPSKMTSDTVPHVKPKVVIPTPEKTSLNLVDPKRKELTVTDLVARYMESGTIISKMTSDTVPPVKPKVEVQAIEKNIFKPIGFKRKVFTDTDQLMEKYIENSLITPQMPSDTFKFTKPGRNAKQTFQFIYWPAGVDTELLIKKLTDITPQKMTDAEFPRISYVDPCWNIDLGEKGLMEIHKIMMKSADKLNLPIVVPDYILRVNGYLFKTQ